MLQRKHRLQKNKHFQRVYRRGKSSVTPKVVVIYLQGRQGVVVGFSVSKKLGGSVQRNLIKRRLRECVRPLLGEVKNGQYIIVAREGAKDATFQQLKVSVLQALKRGRLFREEK